MGSKVLVPRQYVIPHLYKVYLLYRTEVISLECLMNLIREAANYLCVTEESIADELIEIYNRKNRISKYFEHGK